MRKSSAIFLACCCFAISVHSEGFKFSNPSADEQAEAATQSRKDATIAAQLATPCHERIKNRKIVVLVAEEINGALITPQSQFGRHVDVINQRLQALGLKTYSGEQLRKQVAQEEVDAYFKNDPDRALSASRRLAAQYVLKGVIATGVAVNTIVNVNQVSVNMDFTLVDASGHRLSTARASHASYAGADVAGMALQLVEERAGEVVAQLYSDYCRAAR